MMLVVLVILARSAIFVFWEQAAFDSDQAIIGLMAKHLVERRAFPMFVYGQNYLLGVDAWLAAPVFAVAGVSVATLKLPLLAINIVVGLLLVHLLEREAGLRPALGALAAVFFVLPPPGTAGELVNAAGPNLGPFLYVVLIWMTRRRPALCGLITGVGLLQREFTVYAPMALLAIGAADGALFTRDGLRRVWSASRVVVEVWLAVAVLKTYSSVAGPGTTIADLPASNSIRNLLDRICFDPTTVAAGVRTVAGVYWARLFGLRVEPLLDIGIDSRVSQGLPGAWVLFAAAMVLALVGIAAAAASRRVDRRAYFPAYLTLVGLLAAGVLVLFRCGTFGTLGYGLLSVFAPIGISAWYLQVEQRTARRIAFAALVSGWAVVAAVAHTRLWTEYLRHPPFGFKRMLVAELKSRGIHYAFADYWNAYYISFLTNEQIVVASTGYDRIREYDRIVEAHRDEAVLISRTPCGDPPGQRILVGAYLCPP